MGYTNRKYPVMEIAIVTQNRPDHVNERSQPGDIIVCRRPHFIIGTKEATEYIWLRVEGLEENQWPQLKSRNYDSDIDHGPVEYGARFDKRRYMIPLNRLKKSKTSFSQTRAKDKNDFYQPFITIDFSDSGFYYYLTAEPPLNVHGLVFDKVKGEYL